MMGTEVSFLTSGPFFSFERHQEFDSLPELSSPIDNGKGGRSFDFVPAFRDTGITEPHEVIERTKDAEGHVVDVVERTGEPQQWYLRWYLSNGCLYTHVRGEDDGIGMIKATLDAISVVETPGRVPFVLVDPPFTRGASADPGYQEVVRYFSGQIGDAWTLECRRPSFLRDGIMMGLPEGTQTVLRAGTPFGVEVVALTDVTETQTKEILFAVVESLREA
jgi:hypothetical protein